MSDESHTPEPWHVGPYYKADIHAPGSHQAVLVHCGSSMIMKNQWNARRIVAAVNACAGISTESLEASGIAKLVAAVAAYLPYMPKADSLPGAGRGRASVVDAAEDVRAALFALNPEQF